MQFLHWLDGTRLAAFLAGDAWANPILLCFHAVGMGTVVGIVWMLNLRVLGFPRALPLTTFKPLLKVAAVGFALNAVSGILMFVTEASRLAVNLDFQLKMSCIVLGGLSLWVLRRTLVGLDWPEGRPFRPASKVAAVVSLLSWLAAIVAGRYIGYTLAPPPP